MKKQELKIRNEERKKLGRLLHDTISNDLMSLQFFLANIKDNPKSENVKDTIEKVDFIRRQVRSISHLYSNELPTSSQDKVVLKKALKDLLIDCANVHPDIIYNYHFFPKKTSFSISKDIASEVFMIIKELVLNAVNHGQCSSIEFTLTEHEQEIIIMIIDDGIGFDITKLPNGIGLKNINERIQSLKGKCSIDSRINYGTTITLELLKSSL